jgi:hypothetical protein
MGPKFAIVFSGVSIDGIEEYITQLKENIEKTEVTQSEEDLFEGEKAKTVLPKVNLAITTYYKGTAIDSTTKKLEQYLDLAPKDESDINYI